MTQFDQRNLSMMMDFYEMTMANGYFADHDKDTKVAFDVFYRKNPDEGGFAIFAGLEQVIEYVENMRFSESDIEYFRAQHMFSEAFLDYLRDFRFTGDIYAMPEGTVMYPDEPILTVVGSLIDAQLVETASSRRSTTSRSSQRNRAASARRQRAGRCPISARVGPTIWMPRPMARALPISVASSARQRSLRDRCSTSPLAARWRTAG